MKQLLLLFQILLSLELTIHTIHVRAQNWAAGDTLQAFDAFNPQPSNDYPFGFFYGRSAAVSGDYAIVSANTGAVYFLHKVDGHWRQIKFFVNPGSSSGGHCRVAIDGDYAVTGMPQYDEDSAGYSGALKNTGAVFIYKKDQGGTDNWGLVKKISASYRMVDDGFGFSVAIQKNRIVVGAPYDDENEQNASPVTDAGAVFIFDKDHGGTDNWGEVQKLVAPERGAEDHFGYAVALQEGNLIVGSPYRDIQNGTQTTTDGGQAYIYEKSGIGQSAAFNYVTTLAPDQAYKNDQFGAAVSIYGNYALVGARFEDVVRDGTGGISSNDAGAAYLYQKSEGTNTWAVLKKMLPPNRIGAGNFGNSVVLTADMAIIGMPRFQRGQQDRLSEGPGSAFIFQKDTGGTDEWGLLKNFESGGSASTHFGYSVAADSAHILIGSYDSGGFVSLIGNESADATPWNSIQTQYAEIHIGDRFFGTSVDIDGEFAAIGAPGDYVDDEIEDVAAGSLYLYRKTGDTWRHFKKIRSPEIGPNQKFGSLAVLSGEYLAVKSDNPSAVFIYKRNQGGTDNWGFVRKINPVQPDSQFGRSISIYNGILVISAPEEYIKFLGTSIADAGTAYVYEENVGGAGNWGLSRKLTAPMPQAGDHFGISVSISKDFIFVGSSEEDHDGNEAGHLPNAGAVFVFGRNMGGNNAWGLVQKLLHPQRSSYARFGDKVSVDGNVAVVTSYNDIVIFQYNNSWQPAKTIGIPFKNARVSGDRILTSSKSERPSYAVYRKDQGGIDQWGEEFSFVSPSNSPQEQDNSRVQLDINGGTLMVGAPFNSVNAPLDSPVPVLPGFFQKIGATYLFNLIAPLPVTLSDFNVQRENMAALITWQTTSESNSDHFEVEHSTDGKDWNNLASINATWESSGRMDYHYTHMTPAFGDNYYRLKMVDADGTSALSKIQQLRFDSDLKVTVYPNPASDVLVVSGSPQIESVKWFNSSGLLVHKSVSLRVPKLTAGTYLVSIRCINGKIITSKIVTN